MRKRMFWTIAAFVLIAGAILASNMAFKLLVALEGPQANASLPGGFSTGTQLIALPFNQQTDLITAEDLLNDIDPCPGAAELVSRYVRSADGLVFYGCTGGPENFTLQKGDAIFVQVNTDINYIIVGTHDPAFTVDLLGPLPNAGLPRGSSGGNNPYAWPYHSVASTAGELIQEINGISGYPDPPGAVSVVARFVKSADALEFYTGKVGRNFTLEQGEGYLIQVKTDVSFVPAHY